MPVMLLPLKRRLEPAFAIIIVLFAPASSKGAGEDSAYVELKTNVPGSFSYVRRDEIEAVSDISPGHCLLFFATGKNIRAFQPCSSILSEIKHNNFVSFPSVFGSIYITPDSIYELIWTTNSGCRLTLKSGKFFYVKQLCNDVHKALAPG